LESKGEPLNPEVTVPSLFSFIVLRQERFGALVYNPFLSIEEELDPVEAYIAALCNDHNSWNQIDAAVQSRFGISREESQKHTELLQNKLHAMFSLKIRSQKENPYPILAEPFIFPEDTCLLSAPKNVIWDSTYQCNLHCLHCLTDSGKKTPQELTTEEACRLIDILADAKIFSLSLSGGEPLLRPDIIHLLEYLEKTRIRVGIATNGVNIRKEVFKTLEDLSIFNVQVSIDGMLEYHDAFRGYHGAFNAACLTIQRLLDCSISVSVSTTVTKENINQLESLIDFVEKTGCTNFKALPFLPAGRGHIYADRFQLNQKEHLLLCKILSEKKRELKDRMDISVETCHSFLFNTSPQDNIINGPMGCSAGYDTLSIGADGMAYPCPFLHDFPLGNILQNPFSSVWRSASVLQTLRTMEKIRLDDPCNTCSFAPSFCGGGCRAAAYLETGDLYAGDPTCFMKILGQTKQSQLKECKN